MSRSHTAHPPCPLCGRITRAHSRITIRDIEAPGGRCATSFATVICRDCAFAMAVRAQASAMAS